MTFDDRKQKDRGAELWEGAKAAWTRQGSAPEAGIDPQQVAAYLDGRLTEEEQAGVESVLARHPDLLDDVLALSELEPETPPVSLTLRAQGLLRGIPSAATTKTRRRSWFTPSGWFQPAAWVSVAAAVIVAWGLAFELGRSSLEAVDSIGDLAAQDFTIPTSGTEGLL